MPRSCSRSSRRSRNTSPRAFAISRIPIVSPSSLSGRGKRGLFVGLRSAVGSSKTVIRTSSAGAVTKGARRARAGQAPTRRERLGLILLEPLRRDVVAAGRRLLQPLPRFGQILRHPEPVHVKGANRPLGKREALVSGLPVPKHRFGIVLRKAPAVFVHDAEIQLSPSQPLVGGSAIPAHRLLIILPDAAALFVHDPDIELGERVSLRGRHAIPAHRFGVILWHAEAGAIEIADI